ncbi:MAG: hypothetical protein WCX88_00615 [Patescibacteria group bacterium]
MSFDEVSEILDEIFETRIMYGSLAGSVILDGFRKNPIEMIRLSNLSKESFLKWRINKFIFLVNKLIKKPKCDSCSNTAEGALYKIVDNRYYYYEGLKCALHKRGLEERRDSYFRLLFLDVNNLGCFSCIKDSKFFLEKLIEVSGFDFKNEELLRDLLKKKFEQEITEAKNEIKPELIYPVSLFQGLQPMFSGHRR